MAQGEVQAVSALMSALSDAPGDVQSELHHIESVPGRAHNVAGSIPLGYATFLDHALDLIFLRRIGGGYIVVHQLLQDYFGRER